MSLLVAHSAAVHAATPLTELRFSPDVTVTLGSSNLAAGPNAVARDSLSAPPGIVSAIALGAIPEGVSVLAYHEAANGNQLFVLDRTTPLGKLTATPRTVVRYAGGIYTAFFNGAAQGIPDGTMIDALALINDTDLLLSFDVPLILPGNIYADASDLVRFNVSTSTYSLYFDGSAAGVAPGLNLQDVHLFDHNYHLLMTFDGYGTLGGVSFNPDDVLEFTAPATWERVYRGSARDARWSSSGSAGDLVALYAQTLHNVLDIDANTAVDARTDALMALRFLFGLRGAAITDNALGTSPVPLRTDPTAVTTYLTTVKPFLDVDGNGSFDALTDGLLIIRYLLGLRGSALTTGALGVNPTRTAAQIEAYLLGLTH